MLGLAQDDFVLRVLCEIPTLALVVAGSSDDMDGPVEDIGSRSCVTRFVKTLLSIMEHGVKPHSKHLTEYFAFLYEFAKMGEEEVSIALYLGSWGCLCTNVFPSNSITAFFRASSCSLCKPYPQWSISTWEPKGLRM